MPDPQRLTRRDDDDGLTAAYFVGLHARDDEIRRLRSALERIAGVRPCTLDPGLPTERSCCMCAAIIDEARRALEKP